MNCRFLPRGSQWDELRRGIHRYENFHSFLQGGVEPLQSHEAENGEIPVEYEKDRYRSLWSLWGGLVV